MLAGEFAPGRPRDRAEVRSAFGDAEIVEAGALVLVASEDTLVRAEELVCALDGSLYRSPGELAELGPAVAAGGEGVIEQLRGDFALLVFHPDRGGVLARDHMGGRSLYFAERDGRLLFATDVHHLLRLLRRRPAPEAATIAHLLGQSAPPTGRTLYEGVSRLEAGCLLELRPDGWSERRYWAPRYRRPARAPREELVRRMRERLVEAIGRRSTGQGTAVMLSGGLDSSTVATLAATELEPGRRPAVACSAVFPDHPSVDESELIDLLSDRFSLRGVRAVVRSGSVLAGILPYLETFELPPISPNLFFWVPLLRRAREQGVEVMLDGEGGDELFGLSPMLLADRFRAGRLLSARKLMRAIPGADGQPTKDSMRRFWREFAIKAAVPGWMHERVRRVRGLQRYAPPHLTPPTARAFVDTLDETSWKSLGGPRWWSYLVETTTRGAGPTLGYEHVRRRAQLAGIDARHPLVDPDVVELVLSLPPELAFDARLTRPLLREVTAGAMPDQIRLRPAKSTFDAVFQDALAGPDMPIVRALLGEDARVAEFVDIVAARRALIEGEPPKSAFWRAGWAARLWRLVTTELWLRLQEDPALPRATLERFDLAQAEVELVTREPVRSRAATPPDRTPAPPGS